MRVVPGFRQFEMTGPSRKGVQLKMRAALPGASISIVSEPRAVATGSYAQLGINSYFVSYFLIRSLPLAVLTRRLQFGPQISGEVGEMPTPSSNIRNPECLLMHFGPLQSAVRKLGLFQSKKGEMRQIA